MHEARSAQTAATLRVLGLHQVPPARAFAQHLATGRDLEPFGHRFLGFNAFWTSHNFAQFSFKKSAQYRQQADFRQAVISYFSQFGIFGEWAWQRGGGKLQAPTSKLQR